MYFLLFFLGNVKHKKPIYDVVFASDSSTSVDQRDLEKQKEFIKNFARRIDIGSDDSRGALLNYGSFANIKIRFDGYQTFSDFEAAIHKINPIGGERRLDRVLNTAERILGEARPNAYKVVVLLLAGTQIPDANVLKVQRASMKLKNSGAKTYIVIFGDQTNIQKLRTLTDRDNDIVVIPSLMNIEDITKKAVSVVKDGSGN